MAFGDRGECVLEWPVAAWSVEQVQWWAGTLRSGTAGGGCGSCSA